MVLEELAKALGGSENADGPAGETVSPVIFWFPRGDFDRARILWPSDPSLEGTDFPGQCRRIELFLRSFPFGRVSGWILPIRIQDYLSWCTAEGAVPEDIASLDRYGDQAIPAARLILWPPAPPEPCWCQSTKTYADCCGSYGLGLARFADPDDDLHLPVLLDRFIIAPTWTESRELAESLPELLTGDSAERLLRTAIQGFLAADRPSAARTIEASRILLRRCRASGIATFAEHLELAGIPDDLRARAIRAREADSRSANEDAGGAPDQAAAHERVRAWQEVAGHPAAAAAPASFRRYAAVRLTEALTALLDTEQGIETLQELATAMRAGLDALPPDSPLRYHELAELAAVLLMSYEQSAGSPALDEAITVLAEALELMPQDAADRPFRLSLAARIGYGYELSDAYHTRYQHSSDPADLDRSIATLTELEPLIEPFGEIPEEVRIALATLLQERFTRYGDVGDIDTAIRLLEPLAEDPACPLGLLTNVGIYLRTRHASLGRVQDLDRAELIQRRVLDRADPGSDTYVLAVNNLGIVYTSRYESLYRIADLEQALALLEQAVVQTRADEEVLTLRVQSLAYAAVRRLIRPHDRDAATRAVRAAGQAAAATNVAPAQRARLAAWSAISLAAMYRVSSAPADNDRAIAACENALAVLPPDDPGRGQLLNDAGFCLLERYRRAGDKADLERAVEIRGLAASVPGTDGPYLPRHYLGLADALHARYEACHEETDMHQSVEAYRMACQHGGHGDLPPRLLAALDWMEWAATRRSWAEFGEGARYAGTLISRIAWTPFLDGHDNQSAEEARSRAARIADTAAESGTDAAARFSAAQLAETTSLMAPVTRQQMIGSLQGELRERYEQAAGRLRRLDRSSLDTLPPAMTRIGYRRALTAAWAELAAVTGITADDARDGTASGKPPHSAAPSSGN
jgi:tetratricopeptide (TPR) repeat protein